MTFLTTTRMAALCLTCLSGPLAASVAPASLLALDLPSHDGASMLLDAVPGEGAILHLVRGNDRDDDDDDRGGDRDDDDDDRGRGNDRDDDDDDRGRGGDRDDDDDDRSGRDRPRIPGGSGCDDPGDIAEHPECRGATGGAQTPSTGDVSGSGRDKPRIPGGSGCDDPQDLIEHPECRG